MTDRKQNFFAFAIILGFLAFRIFYVATTGYDLSDDEAYFWDWSRHPALSYYDQGPMVAWIIRLFTHLLSLSPFSVRIGAPIFMAMTALVIYFLAKDMLRSAVLALLVLLLFHLTPLGAAGGIIMTYYAPQVFFMALVAFFLWQTVKTGDGRWWYPTGVCLGLGLLSHHMFLLFTAEIGLFIILSQKNRRWLKRKEPYLALLLMLLTASPLIIWNLSHNMVMFRHALGMMSKPQHIARPLNELLQYIGGQAGVQTPLFFLAVIWGLCVSGYRGIKKETGIQTSDIKHQTEKQLEKDKYLLLFCLSAPVLLFIALLSLGGRSEANWPASGYITGAIAAAYILAEKYRTGRRPTRLIITASLALTLIIGIIASAVMYYPSFAPKIGIKITPKNDPANRLYGWKILGGEVSEILKDMPAGTFVAAGGYGQAGELAFYTAGQPEIFALPTGRRFSQYDFWNKNMDVAGKDAVFADYKPMSEKTKSLFRRVKPETCLIIRDQNSGLTRREFYIYRCYDYQPPVENLFRF
ncbi:MAG: glycosyltransferase family 39 protein [Candidatus Omnitrophica bacterium]|nr:glycosyltransferase family 39 protein [Candidatus Omnitrophota bacterium]